MDQILTREERDCYDVTNNAELSDLTLLETIDQQSITDLLVKRHKEENMYTAIGDVLIAVNPYRLLKRANKSIYDDTIAQYYFSQNRLGLVPHVFKIAADSYIDMRRSQEPQCILVTGESGAGKTETAKHVLHFVTVVTPETSSTSSGVSVSHVKSQLLNSSPVLEAFGNAKTVRNDNSSRFGKYQELQFDFGGVVIGGKITKFLLEKSRVIAQAEDERNFHIFHQLIVSDAQAGKPYTTEDFRYMMNDSREISSVDDKKEHDYVLKCMREVGLAEEKCDMVMRILRGILLLGNVVFEPEPDSDQVTVTEDTQSVLDEAAENLGLNPEALLRSLTLHMIQGGGRRSVHAKQLSVEESAWNRDTLAKETYRRVFEWIIHQVNEAMDVHRRPINPSAVKRGSQLAVHMSIGILDIYGFEIFHENGFEQFCINYVNEKLQQYFIALTLKQEQEEYSSEGIDWVSVEYFDNRPVCELIEAKRGLFSALDEACTFKNATAKNFSAGVMKMPKNDFLGVDNKTGMFQFTVKHYAGDVTYIYEGFVEKNQDTLYNDLVQLMQVSELEVIQELFVDNRTDAEKAKRPPSVSSQFKQQVSHLVSTLERCKPHYIRCIKPNEEKKPVVADEERFEHQVRYLGLTENVKVRRAGFCFRLPFAPFVQRYNSLCAELWPMKPFDQITGDDIELLLSSGSARNWGIRELEVQPLRLEKGVDYVIGNTKVFIREPKTLTMLESQRAKVIPLIVSAINKSVRMFLERRKFEHFRDSVTVANAQVRRWYYERHYVQDKARILRIATNVRRFISKCKVAAFRRQFKNKPPRLYAQKLQARYRGMASRQALPEDVREKAAGCWYRALRHKLARDIQSIMRMKLAKIMLKKHLAACVRIQTHLMRPKLARNALVARRDDECKQVIAVLSSEQGYPFIKHRAGTTFSRAHSSQKMLCLNLETGKLTWKSSNLLASERGFEVAKLSAIDDGFRASKTFAATGLTPDASERLLVLKEDKKELCMEFSKEWERDRFYRAFLRHMFQHPRPGQIISLSS